MVKKKYINKMQLKFTFTVAVALVSIYNPDSTST